MDVPGEDALGEDALALHVGALGVDGAGGGVGGGEGAGDAQGGADIQVADARNLDPRRQYHQLSATCHVLLRLRLAGQKLAAWQPTLKSRSMSHTVCRS